MAEYLPVPLFKIYSHWEMTMDKDKTFADQLLSFYGMQTLPIEGGYYKQTYLSAETINKASLPARYAEQHPYGTAILYLYTTDADCFSALHRLPTDEIYHFYLGDPVEMLLLYPDGKCEKVILGQDILNRQTVQFTVPRGVWQGSHLLPGGQFALAGTTMAPGYVDADYEGGGRDELIRSYPQEAGLIRRLTRITG
jgi:predicted cupin superfamily sugar epimerase